MENLLSGEHETSTVGMFVEDFEKYVPVEDWELFPNIAKVLKPKPSNADSDEDTTVGGKGKVVTPVKKPAKKKTKTSNLRRSPRLQTTPKKKPEVSPKRRKSPRLNKMVTPPVQKTKSIGFSKGEKPLNSKEFRACFKSPKGRPRRVPKHSFKTINMEQVETNTEEFAKTEEWMNSIKGMPEKKLKDTYKSIFTFRDAERLITHDFLPDSLVYRMAMHFKQLYGGSPRVSTCHATVIYFVMYLSLTRHYRASRACHVTVIDLSFTCH